MEKFPGASGFGPEKERKFHEERWERTADKEMRRGAGERYILKNPHDRTPEEVMRDEADRDNEEFERRKSQEFEKWQSHLRVVVDAIKSTPEGESDTLLLVLGGAMRGAYSAGQLLGLQQSGISAKRFKAIGGVSAGSGPAIYYAAGQAEKSASLFMKECTTKDFFDPARPSTMIETRVIAKEMRKGPKALNVGAVQQSPVEVFTIAKNKRTKKSDIIDMKRATPDMVATTEASSAIPPFRMGVEVNGEEYIDGGFNSIPLDELLARYSPKNILILPNEPFDFMHTRADTVVDRAVVHGASKMGSLSSMATVEAFFKSKGNFRQLLERIEEEKGIHVGIMWPPDEGVGTVTVDPDIVAAGVVGSARAAIKEFGLPQPKEILLDDELTTDDRVEPPQALAA